MLKHDELQDKRDMDRADTARVGGSLKSFGPQSQPQAQQKKSPAGKRLIVGVACAVLAVATLGGLRYHRAAAAKTAAAHAGSGGPVVAVIEGTVQQKDVPIYLDGLGTVQAYNTVTVHVRVDGQLQKVAFVEGQDVHAGDVLAQIDPAPFQAQLGQVAAKKRQDEAQLATERYQIAVWKGNG